MNPPQAAVNHSPPPAPVQGDGSMLGGIISTTAQGMAFGTGSAEVAPQAVDAVLGPRTIQLETLASQVPGAASVPMTRASIVPFEGKPYFTVIMGESNVHRHFLVVISQSFFFFVQLIGQENLQVCIMNDTWDSHAIRGGPMPQIC
ncbi:hypothetical protein MA16_Dca019682 [Dendrobium catenatum]|uniref:Uncharacterized protein n=1 Tax=Dendrobium catenatum TaxID=906689 RepID=A0A2I0VDG1_9ASPA|nr:hypothetical protein MA16_Dca019682 [Dendrobium catenatum]